MTIHYGKRNAGSLTAASPGDTLYIPFATYNDSGASIVDTGFNQADIEIYKNNGVTARATDSGVWLGDSGVNYYVAASRVAASALSDTGLFGNVNGLYSIGIRLFNTTDDTGFYDAGSTYHVTVQGLSIKTGQGHAEVNFIPAVFEIDGVRTAGGTAREAGAVGNPNVNLVSVLGDTGAAHLDQGRLGVVSDSGKMAAVLDTGKVAAAVWTNHATRALTAFAHDTGVADTVWKETARTLTAFAHDTGVANTVWKESSSTYTGDSGSVGYAQGRLMAVHADTGAAHIDQGRLGVVSDSGKTAAVLDTGKVSNAVWNTLRANHVVAASFGKTLTDSGMVAAVMDSGKAAAAIWGNHATRTLTAFAFDTGIQQALARVDTGLSETIDRTLAKTDTGVVHDVWGAAARTLTAFAHDTGVADTVWKYSTSSAAGDSGSVAYAQGRLMAVHADTGAAHIDQGRLGVVSDSGKQAAVMDSGKVSNAVWNTLRANHVVAASFGKMLTDSGMVATVVDTGKVAAAVWTSHAARTVLDTGIADATWKYSTSSATGDSGSVGYAQGRLMAVKGDTGAAHLDAGRLGTSAPAASLDTGATKDAVWGTAAGTNGPGAIGAILDTGLADAVWKYSTSSATGDSGSVGYAQGRLMAVKGDTGAAHLDAGRLGTSAPAASLDTGATKDAVWGTAAGTNGPGAIGTILDTGISDTVWKQAARTLTAFAHDTGVAQTVWRESSSTYTADSGSVAYAQGRLMAVHADTGAAHIDQGRLGVVSDSGKMAAVMDSGKVSNAVWNSLKASHTTAATYGRDVMDSGKAAAVLDSGKASNAVWNTLRADHTVAASFGKMLTDSGMVATVVDTGKVSTAVWDTLLTGSSHNTATSAGRRLRQTEEAFVHASGTIAVITNSHTVTLDAGAVATAGYYIGDRLQITEGTGAGQSRIIVGYSAGKVCRLDSGFITNPDTSSLYDVVSADAYVSVSDADLAEGHVAVYTNTTTITLDTGAASDTGFYTGELIVFTNGSGVGQAREITGYAAGRVLTMSPALVTPVDTGTVWHIQAAVSVPEIVDEVWDELRSAHTVAGSFGRDLTDSGKVAAVIDTGKAAAAVWANHATRTLTAFAFDTGIQQALARVDTGLSETIDRIEDFDTGLRQLVNRTDTGIRQKTDKLTFDTGANELHADIRKVSNVQVKGAGDTGLSNTWRPVTEA